jgi:hypothetical protein
MKQTLKVIWIFSFIISLMMFLSAIWGIDSDEASKCFLTGALFLCTGILSLMIEVEMR